MLIVQTVLNKLAGLFPKQDYQSRMEHYINSRNPQTAGDVESYAKDYERSEFKGFGL